ncbi:hypothetical protein [Desulfomarina profundi]|uniref:hypothetical protein n=1 Tax=Desulfomarina profundi TaxID=2772557 RepID=UPI001E37F0E1|nr:hypothetical protein [Desulfomarina profundi]
MLARLNDKSRMKRDEHFQQNSWHIYPCQVIGIRMSKLGLELIGIDDPKGNDR